MGKAFLVGPISSSITSGNESNLFGSSSSPTEAFVQYSATEAATLTKLGARIWSGGSGTNNVQFRKGGANGNNVLAIVGASTDEDTTHSDSLSPSDLFNLAMTDNGTAPTYGWVKANIEFASGHGCFHAGAAFGGVVCDVPSATRYHPINGTIIVDGSATIANVQWKNRGYTSIEAFQVNVSANARVNNSVFRVNINGTDVGTAITFAATTAGLQSVTGMGISLADGDLICISMTLGTGVEDLTLRSVGVTLKSSALSSEVAVAFATGTNRTASATATYYCPGGGLINSNTDALSRIKVGFAAVCKNLRCYVSATSYTGNATLKLMVNGTARITTPINSGGGAGWYENTTDTWEIADTDEICYEIDEGTSGVITIHAIGITLGALTTLQASGVGSTALVGASTAAQAIAAAGVAAVAWVGSTAGAQFAALGNGAATFAGRSTAAAVEAMSGLATVSWSGTGIKPGVFASSGLGAFSFIATGISPAVLASIGISDFGGVATAISSAVFASDGQGNFAASGLGIVFTSIEFGFEGRATVSWAGLGVFLEHFNPEGAETNLWTQEPGSGLAFSKEPAITTTFTKETPRT